MANAIRGARASKGLRQEDVAEVLGVSTNTYNRMENNPDSIRVGYARKLSRLFGVDLDSLFLEDDSISDEVVLDRGEGGRANV